MSNYNIGDKIIDKESKRQGKIIDIVEETNTEGKITYAAAKIMFESGESDWINNDRISIMLVEENDTNKIH